MLGNLEELIQNNLIKDYERRDIVETLAKNNIKPLKFLGVSKGIIAIETKDLGQSQNQQSLIRIKEKVKSSLFDKQFFSLSQKTLISEISTQNYQITSMPSTKYSLNTLNIQNQFKTYDKSQLIRIFRSLLYLIIDCQQNSNYLGISKESIQFKRDGSIFLNEFYIYDQEQIEDMIQNDKQNQQLLYLPPEILENQIFNNLSDLYTLGLFFLEMLGLQINYDVISQFRKSNFISTNDLPHQDLVNIITQHMICYDFSNRSTAIDLFWLFRFKIEEQFNTQEIAAFIQANINHNYNKAVSDFQNVFLEINVRRVIKELNDGFRYFISHEPFFQNGCVITSIEEGKIQFLLIGMEQSIFENKFIKILMEIPPDGYPYKAPLIKIESAIPSLSLNKEEKYIDIYGEWWSPASVFRHVILTTASIFNSPVEQIVKAIHCEKEVDQEIYKKLKEEFSQLEEINIIYSQYKQQFFQKYQL